MLTVEEAIKLRRTIRHFKTDLVSKELVLQMLEAARLAPSGSNRQPWRYIVVTDAEEKKKLRPLCLDQTFIEEAPVLFVACADPSAYSKESAQRRSQELSDAGVVQELTGRLADPAFRQSLAERTPDPAASVINSTANACIAAEHLVLMATALGLGSCWAGILNYPDTMKNAIKTLLGIPPNILIIAIIAVGYPQYWPSARPRLALNEILLRPLPDIK